MKEPLNAIKQNSEVRGQRTEVSHSELDTESAIEPRHFGEA